MDPRAAGALAHFPVRRRLDIPWSHFCADQNPVERDIDVIIRAPDFLFLQKALLGQRIEIFGGSQARDLKIALNERDLGIRMREKNTRVPQGSSAAWAYWSTGRYLQRHTVSAER